MRRLIAWALGSRRRILGSLILLPSGILLLWFLFLPWPIALRWRNPRETSFMEYRMKEAHRAGTELSLQHEWVHLDGISPNLRRAVLTAEDDRFYQHGGIDWKALSEEVGYEADSAFSWWSPRDLRALRKALSFAIAHRDEIKGRSTITQQLAKNLYFTPRRSMLRKVSEAVVTKRLELFLPKDRILEIYLNVAEWGPGIFGAEAASRAYFHKSARDLSLDQAAALAATLPHPLTSNPSYRPSQMEWRKTLILGRLRGGIPEPPPHIVLTSPPDTTAMDTGSHAEHPPPAKSPGP